MEKGIVIQLQEEALDENIDVESLLRKAYLVAKKLKLKDFEVWIEQEQNGYREDEDIPLYREIHGELMGWNAYHGWIPVIMDGKIKDELSMAYLPFPISVISDSYIECEKQVVLTAGGALTNFLNNNSTGMPTKYSIHFTKAQLKKILSAVRNKVLEWSLLLEENGIVGEGLMFTDVEKQTAKESSVINTYTNNFYANADNIRIKQGEE